MYLMDNFLKNDSFDFKFCTLVVLLTTEITTGASCIAGTGAFKGALACRFFVIFCSSIMSGSGRFDGSRHRRASTATFSRAVNFADS